MKGNHDPELIKRLYLTGMDNIKETFDKETGSYQLQVLNPRHVNIKLDEEAFLKLNGSNAPGQETTSPSMDSQPSTGSASSTSAPVATGDTTIIPY